MISKKSKRKALIKERFSKRRLWTAAILTSITLSTGLIYWLYKSIKTSINIEVSGYQNESNTTSLYFLLFASFGFILFSFFKLLQVNSGHSNLKSYISSITGYTAFKEFIVKLLRPLIITPKEGRSKKEEVIKMLNSIKSDFLYHRALLKKDYRDFSGRGGHNPRTSKKHTRNTWDKTRDLFFLVGALIFHIVLGSSLTLTEESKFHLFYILGVLILYLSLLALDKDFRQLKIFSIVLAVLVPVIILFKIIGFK